MGKMALPTDFALCYDSFFYISLEYFSIVFGMDAGCILDPLDYFPLKTAFTIHSQNKICLFLSSLLLHC